MPKYGKKYMNAASRYDAEHAYQVAEAVELVKTLASASFDETVEAAFRLGIDPRQADQLVRGTVSLPAGTGKTVRVAVFAPADKHADATAAGADVVGGAELVEAIAGGREPDFDLAIATPDLMAEVGKLGRVLGPRGLMPNPKSGTVTPDVAKAVTEFKGGRIEYRNDRYGIVHAPIGKVSFEVGQLAENLEALAQELRRVRPASAKGRYIRSATVSSTMGPGLKVDTSPWASICGFAGTEYSVPSTENRSASGLRSDPGALRFSSQLHPSAEDRRCPPGRMGTSPPPQDDSRPRSLPDRWASRSPRLRFEGPSHVWRSPCGTYT